MARNYFNTILKNIEIGNMINAERNFLHRGEMTGICISDFFWGLSH